MKINLFEGVGTAIITPFTENGKKIDYDNLKIQLLNQLSAGVNAIVVLGTTGESSTLSFKEKVDMVTFTVNEVKDKAKIIVGAGSNNTSEVLKLVKTFEKLGVDGLLVVTPYYNKCTQHGLIEHYQKIAKATKLPIIVYNVPGRTGVNILPETTLQLSKIKNIVGIKEASGNMEQICEVLRLVKPNFKVYSGDDGLFLPVLAMGGAGVISVVSNVYPKQMMQIYNQFVEGKIINAKNMQLKINPVIKSMFVEVNPIPVKSAMMLKGLDTGSVRLPLTKLQNNFLEKLNKEMQVFEND